jgi:hypothetical protein
VLGVAFDLFGGLYLAYDLLGGRRGPLRTAVRATTYSLVFGALYTAGVGFPFGPVAGIGLGLFSAPGTSSPPQQLPVVVQTPGALFTKPMRMGTRHRRARRRKSRPAASRSQSYTPGLTRKVSGARTGSVTPVPPPPML